MYAYLNYSEENIKEEIDGILYEEEWKPINGYEDHYLISNFGRVKSIDRTLPCYGSFRFHKGRIKHATPHYKNSYLSIMLKVGGKEDRWLIHRLVGEHFIPNPDNKAEVNHIYGDKFDCRWLKLEWFTPKENSNHAVETGLSQTRKPLLLIKDVAIMEFKSNNECAKYLGVCASWSGNCARNNKQIKGYNIYYL